MTTIATRLRSQVVRALARVIEPRVEQRIPLARLDGVDRRLDALEARFAEIERLQRWTANELERIVPSVASQEAELGAVRAGLAAAPRAEPDEVAVARSLIDEVRREHAQIKVRLTAVARYEDRLRVVEEHVVGDPVG